MYQGVFAREAFVWTRTGFDFANPLLSVQTNLIHEYPSEVFGVTYVHGPADT
tara:strand:+ start:482 stop:637 length:156 start_codon:yes stop_codon:yes gene_type:complete